MQVTRVKPGAGSFLVYVKNVGGAALDADMNITFWVL